MDQEEFDERILTLKDLKTIPDVVHNYTTKDQKAPLIIGIKTKNHKKFKLFSTYL